MVMPAGASPKGVTREDLAYPRHPGMRYFRFLLPDEALPLLIAAAGLAITVGYRRTGVALLASTILLAILSAGTATLWRAFPPAVLAAGAGIGAVLLLVWIRSSTGERPSPRSPAHRWPGSAAPVRRVIHGTFRAIGWLLVGWRRGGRRD